MWEMIILAASTPAARMCARHCCRHVSSVSPLRCVLSPHSFYREGIGSSEKGCICHVAGTLVSPRLGEQRC